MILPFEEVEEIVFAFSDRFPVTTDPVPFGTSAIFPFVFVDEIVFVFSVKLPL